MESVSGKTWVCSVLYLTFITTSLYLLQTLILGQSILIHNNVILKKQPDLPLRFRADGTFKILQVADLHYGNGIVTRCRDVLDSEFDHCSDLNSTMFLKRMIEAEKPDFIAFTESLQVELSSASGVQPSFKNKPQH
ncbi:hypothetical protein CsSME_00008756 [Camellia sinensis var. sinensis]